MRFTVQAVELAFGEPLGITLNRNLFGSHSFFLGNLFEVWESVANGQRSRSQSRLSRL